MLWKKPKMFWKSGFEITSFGCCHLLSGAMVRKGKYALWTAALLLGCYLCAGRKEDKISGMPFAEDTGQAVAVREMKNEDNEAAEQWAKGYELPDLGNKILNDGMEHIPEYQYRICADFSDEFQAIGGCAVILDAERNTYTFYHEDKCRTRVSPDSTFKIISALIGLHHRVVTSEDSKMGYDGTSCPVEAWNADLSLAEAFQSSCIWYFRKVLDQVGQEKIQQELTELAYGNCDISEWGGSAVNPLPELNGFWIESSLLISPVEQVEVLRHIVEGKTLYTESEVEILKSIMQIETEDSKKIYGKTGTGTDGTAWFVGFVEKKGGNEYFAVYLDDDFSKEINGAKAQEIALDIL